MSVAPGWALDVVSYIDWAAGGALVQNHGRQLGRDMDLQTEHTQQKEKRQCKIHLLFTSAASHGEGVAAARPG